MPELAKIHDASFFRPGPMKNTGPGAFAGYWLAVLPPLLLLAFWHSLDRSYPSADAAGYLSPIMSAVQELKTHGFSLGALYWWRGAKPVITPYLIAPFLAATGSVRLSVACFNLLVYGVFLHYVFRFLRRFLPAVSTVIAVWYVGTLPWILYSAYSFMPELPFLAASMAAVYYLFENEGFKSGVRSVLTGLSLGLVFCIQPFVALVTIGPVYVLFMVRALRTSKSLYADIAAASAMSGFVILAPWHFDLAGRPTHLPGLLAGWALLVGAAGLLSRREVLTKNILLANTVFLSLFLFAMAPFYKTLYDWAHDCTFKCVYGTVIGEEVVLAGFLGHISSAVGGAMVVLAALALVGEAVRMSKRDFIPARFKLVLGASALLWGSFFAALFGRNHDIRYHYLGLTFLNICLIVFVAGERQVLRKATNLVLPLAFLWHGVWVVFAVSGAPQPRYLKPCWDLEFFELFYPKKFPPNIEKDGTDVVAKIARVIGLEDGTRVFPCLFNIEGLPDMEVDPIILAAKERGSDALFEYPSELKKTLAGEVALYPGGIEKNYIVIGHLKDGAFPADSFCPPEILWTVKKIVRLWKAEELESHGLELVGNVHSAGEGDNLLIIKISRQGFDKIS